MAVQDVFDTTGAIDEIHDVVCFLEEDLSAGDSEYCDPVENSLGAHVQGSYALSFRVRSCGEIMVDSTLTRHYKTSHMHDRGRKRIGSCYMCRKPNANPRVQTGNTTRW